MGFSWAYIDCGTNLVQGPGGETGSIQFRDGDWTITGSPRLVWDTGTADPADIHNLHVSGDVHVSGTIFAYSYNVNETIRSTTHLNISGASQFGDTFDDVHQFTGSLRVSGAFQDRAHNVNGMALFVTANADMGLVGINTNPTTSPNNRHAKSALTVVAATPQEALLDSGPANLRLSGTGLQSSFDFIVDAAKVLNILPSIGNGHVVISSSDDSGGPFIVKSDNTDPIFAAKFGAGPDMAAVSIGYASSSTQGLRVSGAVSSSLGLNIKGTAEFSNVASIKTTGSVVVKNIISASGDAVNNVNSNFGGAVQFTNTGTSIQTSGAISASRGIVVGGELILAGPINYVSGIINTVGVISSSATISSSAGATFRGDMFVNDSNVSGTLTVGSSTVIVTNTNISATAAMTLGGAAVFTNNSNANPNSIITSGSISSSAGSLIIGGGTTLSNTLNVSGTTMIRNVISSSGDASNTRGNTFCGKACFTDTGTSIQVSGNILPNAANASNLGTAALPWANIYTADFHMKNDRGDWTIVEEEDYLSIRNNKNGKLYKFVLEEIEE